MITVSFNGNEKRPLGKTSMSPYLCKTSDGWYVAKFVENIDGPKGLINEYIAYEMAQILKLPIPDAAFITIECSNLELDLWNQGKIKILN